MSVPQSQRTLHAEADRFEPKLRRAFVKASLKMREHVSLLKLAAALEAKNTEKALAAAGEDQIEAALKPFEAILRDAFLKGGKIGARLLS